MSATTAGAWKAYLEGLGLGVPVYRDGAPRDASGELATTWPYVTVQEGIAYVPEAHGDTDDPDAHDGTSETVQIDLWQLARSMPDANGRTSVVESYTLPTAIERAARSSRGLAAHLPWRLYGLRLLTGVRWPISDNVVRHTWTILMRRDTGRL